MLLEFLKVFVCLHGFFLVLASATVFVHKKIKLSDEVFRKILHLIAVFAIIPLIIPSNSWVISAFVSALFAAEAFIGTKLGNIDKTIAVERKPGEQQKSMLLLFGTYIIVIAVCWGIYGQKLAAIGAVLAWGVGDAMAALIGIPYGKHKIRGKLIEGTKSVEGTLAMFFSAFTATLLVMNVGGTLLAPWAAVLVSFWVALFASTAELFSRRGSDTFFCPVSAMTAYVILMNVTGGI